MEMNAEKLQANAGDVFDEHWYRSTYQDVDVALKAGLQVSALDHYNRFGRAEGRFPSAEAAQHHKIRKMTEEERRERVGAVWSENTEASTSGYWMAHPMVQSRLNRLVSGDPSIDSYGRLATLLQQRDVALPIQRAVSLGCGFGGLERDLAARGIIREIDAYDLAPGAIATARQLAEAAGFGGLRYHVVDLETAEFPAESVDIVFAHQSVHHVERLDELFTTVSAMLRPGGIFHLHEFVGPARFQWTDAQIGGVNRFLKSLPPRLRGLPSGEARPLQDRPTIADMIAADPSEAIRSDEILPALRRHFDILEQARLGGALLHLGLGNIVQNFDPESPEDRAVLEAFFAAEDAAMQEGAVGSDFVVVTAVKRDEPSRSSGRLRSLRGWRPLRELFSG
jgi:SAM-dependent methyltransferase